MEIPQNVVPVVVEVVRQQVQHLQMVVQVVMVEHPAEEVVEEEMVQIPHSQVVKVEMEVEDKSGFILGNKNIYNYGKHIYMGNNPNGHNSGFQRILKLRNKSLLEIYWNK
jgi:hypothetical protein